MKLQTLRVLHSGFLAILAGFFFTMQAQVTIGSGLPPAKAALLELKDTEQTPSGITDATNVTADRGGLGLPRVELENEATLQPFIKLMDEEWDSSNQDLTKIRHTGLMVYNLATTSDGLEPGVYVWDGDKWTTMGGGSAQRYFHIPSFNIPLAGKTIGDEIETDLYQEYAGQFSSLGNSSFVSSNSSLTIIPSTPVGTLYGRGDLDYVITYYDPLIIDASSISINDGSVTAADRGKLTFRLLADPVEISSSSFINIVFVIKEN